MLVIAVMTAAIGEVLQQTVGLPEAAEPGVRAGVRRVSVVARFRLHREGEDLGQRCSVPAGYCAFAVLVLTAPVEGAAARSRWRRPRRRRCLKLVRWRWSSTPCCTSPTTSPSCRPCCSASIGRLGAPRRSASGALAGVAMTVPFALTLACLLRFPQASVMEAEVPWLPMITSAADGRAGGPALWIAIFGLVAGWTLIETAVGSIHALLRRVESNLDDLPRRWRPASGRLTRGQKAVTAVGGARGGGGVVDVRDHRPGRPGLRHAGLGVHCPSGRAAVCCGAVPVVQGG